MKNRRTFLFRAGTILILLATAGVMRATCIGQAINLPGYLAGLPEEAYLPEFQPAPDIVGEESVEGPMTCFRMTGFQATVSAWVIFRFAALSGQGILGAVLSLFFSLPNCII